MNINHNDYDSDFDFIIAATSSNRKPDRKALAIWFSQSYLDREEWETEQFSQWYAKKEGYWTGPDRLLPLTGISNAFRAWLRRP